MNTTAATSGIHISYENASPLPLKYFLRPHSIWAPPSCFVSHSISRRVRFAGSRGPVKPAFCQSRRGKLVIPEQFTLITHPVSVEWRRGVNNGAHLFQSTADIDIQNAHKHTQKCIICINYLSLLRSTLLLRNCEGSQSAFIYKFEYKNSNTHASVEGPPCPDMFGGGGESFKMAALCSE